MWDTQSRVTAQTSAWCGMATLSGTGFLSKVGTSTSGSTGRSRQNDPGLRRWQSLSRLDPGCALLSPSLGTELRVAGKFRHSEVVQWLQDSHEHLDTQLERLRTRDAQLSYHISSAQLLDMKHKQMSEAMSTAGKETTDLYQFEKNQKQSELHEKVLKLEKDLMQMRSTLDRGSNDQPSERTGSLSGKVPVSEEDFNRHKEQMNTELRDVKEAETRAIKQAEAQNQAVQQLQSSAELQTHRVLLNQIEDLNQRLSHTVQNPSEVQEQLIEANNKISQACLEKAILSTQILKLEDNIQDLKAKLTAALSDKRDLIQEKADQQRAQVLELERTKTGSEDAELHNNAESHKNKQGKETVLMKEESKVKENLACELESTEQRQEVSQRQLQKLTAETVNSSKQISDLEAENAQLIREKEELLSKLNDGGHEMKDKCCQLRESLEVLRLEKQKLLDQCLCLEAKLLEKEEKLQLQEEKYHKKDATSVQNIEELKAMASHWTEKWQNVALTLQSTQEELENLKKGNSKNEKKSVSLLKVELDACKQELELERSRSHKLLHRFKEKGGEAQDKEMETDLSESSLSWEPPPEPDCSQNKYRRVCIQDREVQWLKVKLAEKEEELREKVEALTSSERLREAENTEAQIKISALELKLMEKTSEEIQDGEGQANVSITDSLKAQLKESRTRMNQLQQEKVLSDQRLQTLKQLYPNKDEKQSVESRKDKNFPPVYLEADQQRRMITEQLKNLFKEREEKNVGRVDNAAAAGLTEASSPPAVRTPVDGWNWRQNSGLKPVFEEDEEGTELPGEEEDEPGEGACAQESLHNHRHQMSAMNAANIVLKANNESLLQDLRFKQTIQDLHTPAEKVSSNADLPSLCSEEGDPQRKPYFLYPGGIFLVECVDICSPDENEEDEEDK